MDQKPSSLDPKLKEAYDRVMGFSSPQTQTQTPVVEPSTSTPQTPVASQSNPAPATPPTVKTEPFSKPEVYQKPPTPTVNPMPIPTPKPTSTLSTTFVASNTAEKPKSGGISPAIIILGALVFFIVYILFWFKFFNVTTLPGGVSIPFLSQ